MICLFNVRLMLASGLKLSIYIESNFLYSGFWGEYYK
jgi:hypothetical protein